MGMATFLEVLVVDGDEDGHCNHKRLDTMIESNPANHFIVFVIGVRVSDVIFVKVHVSITCRIDFSNV